MSSPRDRSVRRALLLPPALVLALALLASVGVHLPIYAGLGILEGYFTAHHVQPPAATVELVLSEGVPSLPPEPAPAVPDPRRPEEAPEPEATPRRTATLPPPPEQAAQVPPAVLPAAPAEPPPPPPELDERRAVVQRSQDPSVEAPDDAQFLAEENNDVEEQTVATVTSTVDDAADPTAAQAHASAEEAEGDSDESVAADLRDADGDDRRVATREEIEREHRPDRADPSTSRTPTARGGDSLDPGHDEASRAAEARRTQEDGARAAGGGADRSQVVVISDAFGTYAVRILEPQPEGTGDGEAGGERAEGRGEGERGAGLASASEAARGGARQGGSRGRAGQVELGLSWSQFESIYGEEELQRERQARLEERRSRSRGASREERWRQFRAAMENYVSEVRPGNQTALDAAASPFAVFLSDMHRRIHREFADRYLAGLGLDATDPENDPSLQATLEIAIRPDGSIERVGIVETSGNILFDFGAFNAVMRAQPFPRPPSAILSGDGHAWLHWRFDRGPRQCGTWNARPFMLDNAPLIDRGEPPQSEPGEPDSERG